MAHGSACSLHLDAYLCNACVSQDSSTGLTRIVMAVHPSRCTGQIYAGITGFTHGVYFRVTHLLAYRVALLVTFAWRTRAYSLWVGAPVLAMNDRLVPVREYRACDFGFGACHGLQSINDFINAAATCGTMALPAARNFPTLSGTP